MSPRASGAAGDPPTRVVVTGMNHARNFKRSGPLNEKTAAEMFTPEELRAGLLSHCALPPTLAEPAPQVTEKIERDDGSEE